MKMFENFKKGLIENESILSIIVSFLSKSLDRLTNQPTDKPRQTHISQTALLISTTMHQVYSDWFKHCDLDKCLALVY